MQKPVSLPLAHLCALFTVTVWGATFIASKHMLSAYSPIQIMILRFILAYCMLWLLYPHAQRVPLKDELYFLCMGCFGNSCYFFLENTALIHTFTSNVSIILSAAPLFTAVLAHFFTPEKMRRQTVYGSFVALFGVCLVIFNGTVLLKLSPHGDLLAVSAAFSWAVYSILLRKKTSQYDGFFLARRVTLWGFLTALPLLLAEGRPFLLSPLTEPTILFSWLFLGVLGSALCYVLWNTAVFRLGVVTTNTYIFFSPFITMLCAYFLLHEPISLMGIVGALLIISGIVLANHSNRK